MRGVDVIRRGPERLRVGPWRGDARVAFVAPLGPAPPPSSAMVAHGCEVLAARGYVAVVTGALSGPEQPGFLAAGFSRHEELHLLTHPLGPLPPAPRTDVRLRPGRRGDRDGALHVDGLAFDPFWRLDRAGLAEAVAATPTARFRVAGRPVAGYAVTGRAADRGFLQRLAVDPALQGRGLGRLLVLDALRWLQRRGAREAVVNTQSGNERALRLYQDLGFRLQPSGLAVLGRRLEDRQLTS